MGIDGSQNRKRLNVICSTCLTLLIILVIVSVARKALSFSYHEVWASIAGADQPVVRGTFHKRVLK